MQQQDFFSIYLVPCFHADRFMTGMKRQWVHVPVVLNPTESIDVMASIYHFYVVVHVTVLIKCIYLL